MGFFIDFFRFEIFDFHGLTERIGVFHQQEKGREKND